MTDRSLFQSLMGAGCSSCGVWPLRNWSCQQVCMWALDSIAGDCIYKVFTGPVSTVIGFEAWFPLCSAFPQNLQAWSIKECEIYSKSHCCLFSHSQRGCAFFSGVELFAVENKQSLFLWFLTSLWDMMRSRKPAVPIWESASAFVLSCRLCWINEVLQCYREKGDVKKWRVRSHGRNI